MPEKLIEICRSIIDSKKLFTKLNISVVARYNTTIDNNPTTIWIYLNEISIHIQDEIEGTLVYKNSIAGNTLFDNKIGVAWNYSNLDYLRRIINHSGITHNRAIYENKSIEIENINEIFKYNTIEEFFKILNENSIEIQKNEESKKQLINRLNQFDGNSNIKEVAIIKDSINKEIEEINQKLRKIQLQQDEMRDLTRFIRKQGELRYNPILDPIQNRIKTSHLYDGHTVIINGGPGTGKTTTMIQRLKYLIDEIAINEDSTNENFSFKLNESQRNKLFNLSKTHKDWLFFSPSQLLKQYLSNAMNKEGLTNTNNKVKNWDDFRRDMMLQYEFFNPVDSDNAPFVNCKSDSLIFKNNTIEPLNDFKNFFILQLRNNPNKLGKIKKNSYLWSTLALKITKSFDNPKLIELNEFILLFYNLERNYGGECTQLIDENRKLVTEVTKFIQAKINENSSMRMKIENILLDNTVKTNDELIEITDEFPQDDDTDDYTINEDMTAIVNNSLKKWIKRYCMNQLDSSVTLNEKQNNIKLIIGDVLNDLNPDEIKKIGELSLFEPYAKYTTGIHKNILSGFITKYKAFRRSILKSENSENCVWDLLVLENIVKNSKGKQLHKQEQSLILGFINNLIKEIKSTVPTYKISSKYSELYEFYNRPIIGVDEATDFSSMDIYAMLSFTSNEFSAITICGDLMQRLTKYGIKDWNDLDFIIPKREILNLKTSYRQSSLLISVAKEIYFETIGKKADFNAYIKSKKVPKPLTFNSENELEKIYWIERRIIEVYKAYDMNLPSIAIFLNNKNEIPNFVNKLRECDFFESSGINIIDGSSGIVLADANDVRVYPVDVVKGMEFDVVFFHNIDNCSFNDEISKRYIYVGLSRAAFFLAFTTSKNNENLSKYFEVNSDWSKII